MAALDLNNPPPCSIDFPLELTPEEIASQTGPINTLLKSSYLLGSAFEIDTTVNSLFDIAEEIAGVEGCGYIRRSEASAEGWDVVVIRLPGAPSAPENDRHHIAPVDIASRFEKAVILSSDRDEVFREVCDAWGCHTLISFPLQRDRDIVGGLVFGKRNSNSFNQVQIKLLWALAMQAQNQLQRNESIWGLSAYSFLDPLTHLYNRRYFDNQLEKEILRSRRTGEPFSLLIHDLDGFKEYHDRCLAASGDIALQEFAGILGGSVREVDTVARLSGSAFAVILLDSNTDGALSLADRIIQRFRRHLLPDAEGSRTERLSVSIGIASFPADSFDKADLFSKANRALYAAKERNGGRACQFHEITGSGKMKSRGRELPIRKIFDAGRSVVDMDKFLEILLFTGMQGMGAGRGSIVVRDPAGDCTLSAAIGFDRHEEHLATAGRFRPGPVTAWVVDHQLPLIVSRPEDSPVGHPLKKNGYQTESFLSIPLVHRGQSLGAIHLTNRFDRTPFTRQDMKSFSPITTEITAILDQGMRFRENVRAFSLYILSSLSGALELRFPFLSGHSDRVRDLSVRIGERLNIRNEDLFALRHAAALHDVGIVGVPGDILTKAGSLSDQELELARKHPFLGSKMLEGVPGMDLARRTILEHHEKFDGSGYPYGLRGEDISVTARILSVSEYYDSIVSARPYRDGIFREEALQMVKAGEGTLFDREICNLFLDEIGRSAGDRIN